MAAVGEVGVAVDPRRPPEDSWFRVIERNEPVKLIRATKRFGSGAAEPSWLDSNSYGVGLGHQH